MSVYAIGDIQGCLDDLRALLETLQFDRSTDQIWLVGDLVNRGPQSLETLRFVRSLGKSAVTVLGNHDLHLLAMANGNHRDKNPGSLEPILQAADRDELLDWLRHRPLLHRDKDLGYTMIHAGLPPQWTLKSARQCAKEVENVLQGSDYKNFFRKMYGDLPDLWDPDLEGMDRYRFITNCFTRLRYCSPEGQLQLKQKGSPFDKPNPGSIPWFDHPQRRTAGKKILFGHWSTLGYHHAKNTWALDSGCLWGGTLTALQLDTEPPVVTQIPCPGQQDPSRFT